MTRPLPPALHPRATGRAGAPPPPPPRRFGRGRPVGRNLATSLPHRASRGDAMSAYDALPPALRRWLAGAALPWSARSAGRLWRRALAATGGDAAAALAHLDAAQTRRLARDAPGVWGRGHPVADARGGIRGVSAACDSGSRVIAPRPR